MRILITGATSGIGRDTARALAAQGHHVLVHGRDPARVAGLARDLDGDGLVADLASLASTVRLAARTGPVDVVIANAGVGFGADRARREVSRDGFELRFAINYLAP